MVQYTEDFIATARHGYENTDQPMRELARELGIGITTLSTLAETHGWAKRSQRKRGLPPAMQLLAEVQALAVPLPSRKEPPDPSPLGTSSAEGGEQSATAPVAAEPPPTLLDRMEQILEQLITAEEVAPANGIRSPQSARNLATLIQAMRALKGMRGHASSDTGPIENDDDDSSQDLPRDIDEFRRDLARRIDAFVASETNAEDADENSGAGAVDAVG